MFLAPDNLVVKEINGTPVTGRGLLECFKVSRKRSHEDCMTILHSAWCMLGCAGTPMHEMMFPCLLYVQAYMKVFHGDNLPEPKGMLQVGVFQHW